MIKQNQGVLQRFFVTISMSLKIPYNLIGVTDCSLNLLNSPGFPRIVFHITAVASCRIFHPVLLSEKVGRISQQSELF